MLSPKYMLFEDAPVPTIMPVSTMTLLNGVPLGGPGVFAQSVLLTPMVPDGLPDQSIPYTIALAPAFPIESDSAIELVVGALDPGSTEPKFMALSDISNAHVVGTFTVPVIVLLEAPASTTPPCSSTNPNTARSVALAMTLMPAIALLAFILSPLMIAV
jgi:hypothetical protein